MKKFFLIFAFVTEAVSMDSCVDVYEKPQHTTEYLGLHVNDIINNIESFQNISADDSVRYQSLKDSLSESRKKCEEALKKLRSEPETSMALRDRDTISIILFGLDEVLPD